jgi:hypothetical protein
MTTGHAVTATTVATTGASFSAALRRVWLGHVQRVVARGQLYGYAPLKAALIDGLAVFAPEVTPLVYPSVAGSPLRPDLAFGVDGEAGGGRLLAVVEVDFVPAGYARAERAVGRLLTLLADDPLAVASVVDAGECVRCYRGGPDTIGVYAVVEHSGGVASDPVSLRRVVLAGC